MRRRSVKSIFSEYDKANNNDAWDFNVDVDDNDDISDIYSTDDDYTTNNNNNTNSNIGHDTNTNTTTPNKEIEIKNNINDNDNINNNSQQPQNKPLIAQHNYSSTQHSIISRLSPLVSPMNATKYSSVGGGGQYAYNSTNKIKLPLPNIIKLNVGGIIFSTTLTTLRKYDCMLSKKFSGDYDAEYDHETDSYFIDRDGTHFRYILNYLRNGKFIIEKATNNSEKSQLFYQQLYEEVCYYQIDPLINILNPENIYFYSKILPNKYYVKILKKWISNPTANQSVNLIQSTDTPLCDNEYKEIDSENIGRVNQKWKLIYRASDNGFSACSFHSYCDLQGSTITLIYANNRIFGGYTDISWKSDAFDKYVATKQECINTFIFVMNYSENINNLKAFKWNFNEKAYSSYGSNLPVVHESHIGPSFGWYHILKKRNNELNNVNNISNDTISQMVLSN